ncbi:Rab43 protein [Cladochytrium replicatum]|nr:Rab43 protein [Cladochytrium replicatum]
MARNEEKANSMLYRFREAQQEELGLLKSKQRRPYLASMCDNIPDAEVWRQQIIREISRKVSKIQDSGLTDHQVRDLNDDINKSIREKRAWEYRIKELGGADYTKSGSRVFDAEGKEVPGTKGYKYFGRARDLPGVRELFEQLAPEPVKKTRYEMHKKVDADYFGYRDEEDGTLLKYEANCQENALKDIIAAAEGIENNEEGGKKRKSVPADDEIYKKRFITATGPEDSFLQRVPVVVTQKEVEEWILRRKKKELMERFL